MRRMQCEVCYMAYCLHRFDVFVKAALRNHGTQCVMNAKPYDKILY